jgi:archaellin
MYKQIRDDDSASIGIGAMIVFIALILVAAVASAVIIQTAENLQQNAQATGDDTQAEIAGKVQVHAAFANDAMAGWDLVFSLAPGSGSILDTAISYQIFCLYDNAGASTFGQDTGTFDSEAISLLSLHDTTAEGGFSAAGAASTLAAGTKYVMPMGSAAVFADCTPAKVNTGWIAGDNDGAIELYIHVKGGGTTHETLDAGGSLSEGDTL